MTELHHVLTSASLIDKPILFRFSDGGPDHKLTYLSVQLSLICLFLKLDLDYLCTGRTAPYHSWRNPVERIMSVLNLGLQCVRLDRQQMSDEFEKDVLKCNNLSELREHLTEIKVMVQESLSPFKALLCSIFSRLKGNYTPNFFYLQMISYKVLLLAKIVKNYTTLYFMLNFDSKVALLQQS